MKVKILIKEEILILIPILIKDQFIMQVTIKIEIKIQILIKTQIKVKILNLFVIRAIHQEIHLGVVTKK